MIDVGTKVQRKAGGEIGIVTAVGPYRARVFWLLAQKRTDILISKLREIDMGDGGYSD